MPRTMGARWGVNRNGGAEALLHLGGVAVVEQAVGHEILVDGGEVEVVLRGPAGSRGAAGRVHDQCRCPVRRQFSAPASTSGARASRAAVG